MKVSVISPEIYTYGAMLIGGILRDNGHEVKIASNFGGDTEDVVMLSLYSTQHLISEEIKEFIRKKRADGGTVVIGGPVSAYPEIVMGELEPDFVVIGEGEDTVIELLNSGFSKDIAGIAFMDNSGIVIREKRGQASVHHGLPLIPADISRQSIRGASAYIETHRGCTGACTFCQVPRFFGRNIRSRHLEDILAEVREFKRMGATRLSISGGTGSLYMADDGNFNEDAFVGLLKEMAAIMGPKNISSPDIRVDCISERVLDAIRDYSIGWVFFGVESGSDRILREMGKGATVQAASDAVFACRKHGLKVAGSFIVGHPKETEEDFELTKDFVTEHSLDDAFVSVAEPIPMTPLADLVLKTPRDDNPVYIPHTGEYKSLKLTEAEARSFDLQMHADMFKPGLHVVTDDVFSAYLAGVRKDGEEVRAATELLFRYYGR